MGKSEKDQPDPPAIAQTESADAEQTSFEYSSLYSGPLPPPAHLAQYEQVQSGLADRIVSMAEKEQAHRIDTEQRYLRASISSHRWGQFLGTFLAVLGFAVAAIFGYWGHATVGATLAGGVVSAIVGVLYVRQRYSKDQSKEEDV